PKTRVGVVALSSASTPGGVSDIPMHLLNLKAPLANLDTPEQHATIPGNPEFLDRYTGGISCPTAFSKSCEMAGGSSHRSPWRAASPSPDPYLECLQRARNIFSVKVLAEGPVLNWPRRSRYELDYASSGPRGDSGEAERSFRREAE